MSYLHINEIIELARVEAVAFKLHPNAASTWRNFCRDYSKLFSTPYHEVLLMSPEFVISTVLEERLDEVPVIEKMEELMERIYTAEDPNYESSKEKDLQSWIQDVEIEENQRVKAGKPINLKKKSYKKEQEAKPKEEAPKDLPKEGFINLAYLANNENEG